MPKPPAPPPEARLLKLARLRRNHMSIAEAAELSGVSVSLWRQVEAGYSTPAAGVRLPKVTPADTLAVMSRPLGITPAQLTEAGRGDAAAILADLLRPEPAAAPQSPAGSASPDDADAMENAVIVAATPRREREIWAEIRRGLQATPAGAGLLNDPAQARAWPPGSAPLELTEKAIEVLDATPADMLLTDPAGNAAIRLAAYDWHKRVQWAAAGRAILRPTSAVRRAG